MWSLAHWARKEKGEPAWEGSRSNCWEIKTPGVAPGGGKRRGVWPARQGRTTANPPGKALVATAEGSRLRALHQAGGRDVEFGLPGKDGQRQTRLGVLSWQLLGDQDSRRCTRRGKRRGVWPARQGQTKANPPGRALTATAGRSRLQALHQAGEETWSLACQARTDNGKPAWEGSRGNC
ncbi:hypothetical protein ROHU_024943 [Labeo rohita]|uniref:Uncharacterized protein n=1 Tax=Labeo rohita TaxID=84645 RepID=A0A498MKQ8_LABRO|nr:hypothetical protein ROHU_024943 [Labeo rohita]